MRPSYPQPTSTSNMMTLTMISERTMKGVIERQSDVDEVSRNGTLRMLTARKDRLNRRLERLGMDELANGVLDDVVLEDGDGDGDDGDGIHDDGDDSHNNGSGSHNDSSHNDTTHNNTPSHSRSSPSQRDRSRSRHHAHTHHDHSPSHSHSRPDRSRSRNDHSHSHRHHSHSRHHRSPSPDDTYRYGVEDAHNETWLREGLEVKVMNQKLGDGALYKKKGVVTGLIDPFTAKVRIPECNLSIKIDQVEMREEGEE